MRKKYYFVLFVLFILAFVVRIFFLKDGALTFGYDQARDATHATEIAKGHLKILGPPSSAPGLFHGVLYYYVLAPFYFFGNGSPIVAAIGIAFINSIVIFIVFLITFLLTKDPISAILSSLFFAFSFESTQYATWLSNPTIGVLTVALYYFGLWLVISKKNLRFGAIVAGLSLGFSVQAEVFLLYHIVPGFIWYLYYRKNIEKRYIVWFLISFLMGISTMLISEVKFGFRGLGGLMSVVQTSDAVTSSKGFGDIVTLYLNQIGRVLSYNSYASNIGYGTFLVIGSLFYLIKYKNEKKTNYWPLFLSTWLFSSLSVVSLGGVSTPFLLVGIGSAVSIILGSFIGSLIKSKNYLFSFLLIVFVLFGSLSMIIRENQKGSTIFSIQKDMLLSKQIKAIDYTYLTSNGEKFDINSLTSPLWINIVWAYLYNWYGQSHYGYTPNYVGRDQIGQVVALNQSSDNSKIRFLIIEPLDGIPLRYLDETVGEENYKSKLIDQINFGQINIQYRRIK